MSRFLSGLAFAALIAGTAQAGPYQLGREATPAEIAAWDIDVRPDGLGLPEGHGTAAEGEEVFAERCAVCHGDFGEGRDRWPVLAGGQDTLTKDRPVKTIGSYWPYLSTVWDYVHRAMPFGDAQSLSPDQVYAITAYLLSMNDIITDDSFELNRETFITIHMPNEANFTDDPRPDIPLLSDGAPCMENCKSSVEITMHATVLDVTPEDGSTPTGADSGEGTPAAAAEAPATETATAAATTTEAVAAAPQPAPDPALIAAGETVFKKCKACHMVGDNAKNRVGPQLNDLFGREAGSAEGFKYSAAMSDMGAGGLVWSAETLEAFLADPKGYVPRTKMSFKGLDKPEDRAGITAYLRQFAR